MRTQASRITGAAGRWKARLTGPKHPGRTAVAAALVLVAASALAGRGDAGRPFTGTVSLESGVGASVSDRALQVPAVSVDEAKVKNSKGTPKLPRSALAHLDIPGTALLAYQTAVLVMEEVDESCGLDWPLLAAIGRVESNHGRYGGAELRADGTSNPAIRGIALDGTGPVSRIRDTDAGQLDGDAVWDRAVGPMQFLPATWSVVGVDADGDFARSPDDIDDAALAAAVFLCSAPGSLSTESGRRTAVLRYNPSSSYVASVLAIERSYRAGDFDTAGEPVQADSVEILATRYPDATTGVPTGSAQPDAGKVAGAGRVPDHGDDPATDPSGPADPHPAFTPDPDPAFTPDPDPTITPDPDPTEPPEPTETPDPTPTPDPEPEPDPEPDPSPDPVQLTGVLTPCVSGWCLGELPLDVGNSDFLASASSSDFDADGVVETTTEELTGLADTEVSLLVAPDTAPALVLALNGVTYALG